MLNKKIDAEVGVIVGRFQVHRAHEAHIELIESVLARHTRVLCFLGLSPLRSTLRNPLDFRARKAMLQAQFGHRLDIHYVDDCRSDEIWSKNLDRQIQKWVLPGQTAILYGARDSFLSHYLGKYPTMELESKVWISGTEIRRKVINDYPASEDFRAGMIAASAQHFPLCYATVDIAVLDGKGNVLLAQKPNEIKWQFIGGFSEPKTDSYEIDAHREVMEEANVEVGDITYIGSTVIDDWRYRAEVDKIKTLFFKATYMFGRPEGGDDVAYVKWFPLNENVMAEMMESHKVLMKMLLCHLNIVGKDNN